MPRYREWDLACKVYVGNLGSSASKYEIENAFSKYGPLRNVWVARNPPGFAFVEFEDRRDAEDATRGLDGTRCCGTRIRVEMSSGRSRRDDRRRGGGVGGRDGISSTGRDGVSGGGRGGRYRENSTSATSTSTTTTFSSSNKINYFNNNYIFIYYNCSFSTFTSNSNSKLNNFSSTKFDSNNNSYNIFHKNNASFNFTKTSNKYKYYQQRNISIIIIITTINSKVATNSADFINILDQFFKTILILVVVLLKITANNKMTYATTTATITIVKKQKRATNPCVPTVGPAAKTTNNIVNLFKTGFKNASSTSTTTTASTSTNKPDFAVMHSSFASFSSLSCFTSPKPSTPIQSTATITPSQLPSERQFPMKLMILKDRKGLERLRLRHYDNKFLGKDQPP